MGFHFMIFGTDLFVLNFFQCGSVRNMQLFGYDPSEE